MGVKTMRRLETRWRLLGASVLLLMTVPLVAILSGSSTGRVIAQASDTLLVSYPVDGTRIVGPTIPVVWGTPDDAQVALILDDAVDPSSGGAIETGDGVVIATESPALLGNVEPGDHTVTVVPVDADGVPADGSSGVAVDVTVTPAQTAGIYPGLCSAIGAEPSHELAPVAFAPDGLGGDVWPDADAVQTRTAGVPATIPGVQSETLIDAPLSDLLDRAQVISVSGGMSAGSGNDGSAACGEVGGLVSSGVLTIGLRQQPDSSIFGVATLVDQGDSTRVVIETATTNTAAGSDIEVLDEGEVPVELPVSLQQGVCDSLSPDVSTDFPAATEPLGDEDVISGVAFATRVLISETTIEEPVNDLLARASSITTVASGLEGIDDGELVACGEVGGPLLSGVARVALTERNGSGVQGFATLFAEGDSTTILVELFRVGGSNALPPDQTPSDVPDPAASDAAALDAAASDAAALDAAASDAAGGDTTSDLDEDGVADGIDNCPSEPNPDQADVDGNGVGDACDEVVLPPADDDGDGVPNVTDNCTFVVNPDQADSDGDGFGDPCDGDGGGEVPTEEPSATEPPVVEPLAFDARAASPPLLGGLI
jgi:hypothetical protein